MAEPKFRGIFPPILTPLKPDETVDRASMKRLVDYLIENGVHGIWATGTTGEFACIAPKERLAAMEAIVEAVNGRVPIIANIGDGSTGLSVQRGLDIKHLKVDAVASTPPYYYPDSQDELLEHFRYIRSQIDRPLFIYNIPQTVKVTVNPATIVQLAKEGTAVGIKDSSGAGELLAEMNILLDLAKVKFARFLGTWARISSIRGVGVEGAIPSGANLFAKFAVKSYEAGEAGNVVEARKWDDLMIKATRVTALGKGGCPNAGTIAGLKAALKIMGILDHDTVSRPLRPYTEDEKAKIPALLKEVGLL